MLQELDTTNSYPTRISFCNYPAHSEGNKLGRFLKHNNKSHFSNYVSLHNVDYCHSQMSGVMVTLTFLLMLILFYKFYKLLLAFFCVKSGKCFGYLKNHFYLKKSLLGSHTNCFMVVCSNLW